MFCNYSLNVQLADLKNIYTCLTLHSFLHIAQRWRITFYLRENAGKLMCVYIWHECAVCVRMVFNNHYNTFLAYTSQIWPAKKKEAFLIQWIWINWNSLWKISKNSGWFWRTYPWNTGSSSLPNKEIPPFLARFGEQVHKHFILSTWNKNDMKLKQNIHGWRLQAT